MSIAAVTSRISQIQSQIAQLTATTATLAPTGSGASTSATAATTASAFADTLQAAAADTGAGTGGTAQQQAVVAAAKKMLGLPYVWGGTDPNRGVDCSGLVQNAYKAIGVDLPRVSNQQARMGSPVASLAEAQPGDLIAWDNSSRNNGVDHIAIYLGDGKMIEAPRTGLDVRIIDVPSTPDVIRRIVGPDTAGAAGAAAGAGTGAVSARVGAGTPFANLINAAAARTGVPGELIAAVMKQESGFDPAAVSPKGARGLMQLMPATARSLGVTDASDPAQNIDGGARLLRTLLDRFGTVEKALAAYNAGAGAVTRYDGVPPYRETQNYVRSIMTEVQA